MGPVCKQSAIDFFVNPFSTVKEMLDKIIFLYQVCPGGVSKSCGIEAGRLAGLPTSVITRAKQVMGHIEKHSKIALGLRKVIQ